MSKYTWQGILCVLMLGLMGCGDRPLNDPHGRGEAKKTTLYSVFSERPRTLDPIRSYSSNEIVLNGQIYEPPLQYHYLKRPYVLVPLTVEAMPRVHYLDRAGRSLGATAADRQIGYSVYTLRVKPGIRYQPHPAFAKDGRGQYRYHDLTETDLESIKVLSDFTHHGTRELTAHDYVYQIKRLAHPEASSPIFGLMSEYITGLSDYAKQLADHNTHLEAAQGEDAYLDLRKYDFAGVKALDNYTYQITLKGQYPQFPFWLAMPFFAPMPWEADRFYSQAELIEKNITLDWYPVGTGPYMLTVNNPNRQMILARNPHFRGEPYPSSGEAQDKAQGLLADAGQAMPFVDQVVFSLEKENIPMWNKFLQGYYDQSGISSDSFEQAIRLDESGKAHLTPGMAAKQIRLQTSVEPAVYYMGFNMQDDVVGGDSVRARKLRQAISLAVDYQEYITIFLNGRGIVARGPLPPGIFGYEVEEGNPANLATARRLMREAGYAEGMDPKTGKPLVLHYDTMSGGGPDDKARLAWMRKQFAKVGIDLNIRGTQYNRFQEKMRTGAAQIFSWGWRADYPDPENFLFLLYGPNGKVKHGGENAANYHNPAFDKLFERMKNLPNSAERLAIIRQMLTLLREDSPWIWGFHPKLFQLTHHWNRITKPHAMANNTLKYARLDPVLREESRRRWNRPVWWPLVLGIGLLIVFMIPVIIHYYRKEHATPHLPEKKHD